MLFTDSKVFRLKLKVSFKIDESYYCEKSGGPPQKKCRPVWAYSLAMPLVVLLKLTIKAITITIWCMGYDES